MNSLSTMSYRFYYFYYIMIPLLNSKRFDLKFMVIITFG